MIAQPEPRRIPISKDLAYQAMDAQLPQLVASSAKLQHERYLQLSLAASA